MSEKKYKLNITSLEITDPKDFQYVFSSGGSKPVSSSTVVDFSNTDHYFFENLSDTQTIKEFGKTKTIYHAQTVFKTGLSSFVYPVWQHTPGIDTIVNIGKVYLNISYLSTTDNSSKPKFIQLVGTDNTGTVQLFKVDNSSVTSSKLASADTLGTLSDIYKSNFYLPGRHITSLNGSNATLSWEIDLNKILKSDPTNTDGQVGLGLYLNETPESGTIVKVETYVEVVS